MWVGLGFRVWARHTNHDDLARPHPLTFLPDSFHGLAEPAKAKQTRCGFRVWGSGFGV